MQIYLPIAELSVNIWLLLGLGGAVGYLSGLFGVGGGFLLTPLLIFIGVPPAVAVATSANQVVAASVSGFYAHWRKANVDFRMGGMLLAGGLAGSGFGAWLFSYMRQAGHLDLVISLSYVVILGTVGGLMAVDALRALRRRADALAAQLNTTVAGIREVRIDAPDRSPRPAPMAAMRSSASGSTPPVAIAEDITVPATVEAVVVLRPR